MYIRSCVSSNGSSMQNRWRSPRNPESDQGVTEYIHICIYMVSLAASYGHSLALTDIGAVYSWGRTVNDIYTYMYIYSQRKHNTRPPHKTTQGEPRHRAPPHIYLYVYNRPPLHV